MRTGILINARLGSTRLKKKHILTVNGIPILLFLIRRIKKEFNDEISSGKIFVVLATSDEIENREFETFNLEGINIFYGSVDNIPLRHLQAAKEFELDNIISIDGDDILCSVKGMRTVYEELNRRKEYIKTINLPFGMNSIGYSRVFLEETLNSSSDLVLETGWGRIFNSEKQHLISVPFSYEKKPELLRFTLDYEEDYLFFKDIIIELNENIYTATDEEIIKIVLLNKIYEINQHLIERYWDNFNSNVEAEKTTN
ncbi:MAG: cytidylyltransferase domain-containing protein [Bacillota bacterium]